MSEEDRLSAMEQTESVSVSHARKMSGGSCMVSLKSGMRWVPIHFNLAKRFLQQHVDHPIANEVVEIGSSLGSGMAGGAKHKVADRLHSRSYLR